MQLVKIKTSLGLMWSEYKAIGSFVVNLYSEYKLYSLLLSPYLHISLIYSWFTWSCKYPTAYLDVAIVLIAIFIGFSSASFAVFMSLNSEEFIIFQLEAKEAGDDDPKGSILSSQVRSTFIHFILTQSITMFLLLFLKSNETAIKDCCVYLTFIPYLLFIYSLMLNFAIIYHLFMFSTTWIEWIKFKNKGNKS